MNQLESLFNTLEEKLLEISLYGSFLVEDSTKQYKEHLTKTKNDEYYIKKRLAYFDILNNEINMSNSLIKRNAEQLHNDINDHINKQLQWLFIEAYELYEKYISNLYSLVGCLDNNFWIAEDFREIQINDINKLKKPDFDDLTEKKKDKPYSIIKIFEQRLKLKSYYDSKTPIHNYDFLMNLLSMFRNGIVHDSGFINKRELLNKLIKKSGINGVDNIDIYNQVILNYLGREEYENMICLTKVKKELIKGYALYSQNNRFESLISILLSYSKFINTLLVKTI